MLFEVRTFKKRVEICDELFLSKICHMFVLLYFDIMFKVLTHFLYM